EVRPRLPRLGPAADDEFLLVDDLDLVPVGRALAGLVRRGCMLGDQALPAVPQRLLIERAAVAAHRRAEADGRRRLFLGEQSLERRAALHERAIAQVSFVLAEKVEGDERHRGAGGAGGAG